MERENSRYFGQTPFLPFIPRNSDGSLWLALDTEESYCIPNKDPYFELTKASLDDNLRATYNTEQERLGSSQELTPEFVKGQIDGLRAYLAEHELSQPLRFGLVADLYKDGLHYRFGQKTGNSFLKETFESANPMSKYVKLRSYFSQRLGFEPTPEQLWFFSRNPEVFRQLVSDEVFYGTALGLEMAEDLGLIKIEEMLSQLEPGQIVIQFSPKDKILRKTKVPSNWLRIYRTEKTPDGKTAVHTTQIKNFLTNQGFRKIYEMFTGKDEMNQFTSHIVSNPFVTIMTEEEFLRKIGENLDPDYLTTFDETMEFEGKVEMEGEQIITVSVPDLIRENVEMLNGDFSIEQIEEHRKRIGEIVIKIHKDKLAKYKERKKERGEIISEQTIRKMHYQEEMYGMGSGCGIDPEKMADLINSSGQEFGNPNLKDIWICEKCGAVHHINNDDPSTYFENCQSCGKPGKCA